MVMIIMKYFTMIIAMIISFNVYSNETRFFTYKYKIGVYNNRYTHKIFAEELCNALNANEENSCLLVSYDSSQNLIDMLAQDKINLLFNQDDVVSNSYNKSNLKKIIMTHKETLNVVVPFNSKFVDISDLKSKKIAIARNESKLLFNARLSLLLNQWRFDDIDKIVYVKNIPEALNKICKREVDVIVVVSSNPNSMLKEYISKCDLKFIDTISNDFFLTKRYPYYYMMKHNSRFYDDTLKDVKTIGVNSILITNDLMSNDDASYLLSVFLKVFNNVKQNNNKLILAYNTEIKYDIKNNKTIPYHNGALMYYKNNFIID